MKKIINLTPHTINIVDGEGNQIQEIAPSGQTARCSVSREQVSTVNGIPVNRTVFGEVEGLPEPQADTIYIVSALVAQARPDRNDLYIPDDTVRDEQGRIIGCKAFAQI